MAWRRYFLGTARWLGILLSLAALSLLAVGPPFGGEWSLRGVVFSFPAWIGFFLPFASFSGGLETCRPSARWPVLLGATAVAIAAYGLMAYSAPLVTHRVRAERGVGMAAESPYGALTPGALAALRATVEDTPPERFSFRVDRPFERPPNWLTYRIHSPGAMALFAILAALLGQVVGFLTTGLSPPTRRNTRWAVGLLSGIAFFIALSVGESWVRSNPSNSGVLGAWLSLVLPLAELAVLHAILHWRGAKLHGPPSSTV